MHPDDKEVLRPSEGKPTSKLAIMRAKADAKTDIKADLLAIGLAGKAALEISDFHSEADLAMLWDSEDELRKEIKKTLGNLKKYSLADGQGESVDPKEAGNPGSLTLTAQAEIEASIVKLILRWREAGNKDSRMTNQPGSASAPITQEARQLEQLSRTLGTGSAGTVAMKARKCQGLAIWVDAVSKRPKLKDLEGVRKVFAIYLEAGPELIPGFWVEVSNPEQEEVRFAMFLKRLDRFADTVGPRLSAFAKWSEWTRTERARKIQPDITPYTPTELALGAYFIDVRARAAEAAEKRREGDGEKKGKTASAGVWAMLEWWRNHVGLNIPTTSPACLAYKKKDAGHTVDSGVPLQPWMVLNLVAIARRGYGTISTFAALVVLLLGACLRWRHAQRSHLEASFEHSLIFSCAKGKKRVEGLQPPFKFPVPTKWGQNLDLDSVLGKFLQDMRASQVKEREKGPDQFYLVPDIKKERNKPFSESSQWTRKPMGTAKFTALLRTMIAKVGANREQVKRVTAKSLRKTMATAAEVFAFEPEMSNSLGNWQDIPRSQPLEGIKKVTNAAPMPTRYSGENVGTAHTSKTLVVQGLLLASCKKNSDLHVKHLEGDLLPPGSLTWDDIRQLSLASRGSYDQLVTSAGEMCGFGAHISSYEYETWSMEGDDDPLIPTFPIANDNKASSHKGMIHDFDTDTESSSSDEEGESDPEEPSKKALEDAYDIEAVEWFSQAKSKKAHLLLEEDKDDHSGAIRLVPMCRRSYKAEHEHRLKGVTQLHMMDKEFCRPCLQHLREERMRVLLEAATEKFPVK